MGAYHQPPPDVPDFGAHAAPPLKDEALEAGQGIERFSDYAKDNGSDGRTDQGAECKSRRNIQAVCLLASASTADQALRVIEGERKAQQYLARLHAQQVQPDELVIAVTVLYGAALRGFCAAIEKALRGVAR